ncbi:MAG: hypothetical protein ACXVZ2_07105 [Gaiellaceae bacterium]
MAVFTVDQAYRIKSNRALLVQSIAAVAASASVSSDGNDVWLEMHCECSAEHCNGTVLILRDDYEKLSPKLHQRLVAIDHELDSPVRVILRSDAYEVVEPWRP